LKGHIAKVGAALALKQKKTSFLKRLLHHQWNLQ
jgi:hypothetical protein